MFFQELPVCYKLMNEIPSFETWYKYDLEYIENWNLFLDIKILLTTMLVIFKKDMKGK